MVLAGQKISLQGRPEVLRGPASHRPIDHQRRPIHSVSSAEHPGTEAAEQEPYSAVALQFQPCAADQGIDREGNDNQSQSSFDHPLMTARQKQKPKRDPEKSGEHEPACTVEMDFLPVLRNHNAGDGNRNQHCEGRRHLQWNREGEQRDGDQSLTKAEC
jgi:hypothetical protein